MNIPTEAGGEEMHKLTSIRNKMSETLTVA